MLFQLWDAHRQPGSDPVTTVVDHTGAAHVLVSGYREVKEVLADPHTYRPDNALDAVTPLSVSALRILRRYGFRLPPTLANNGTWSHPDIRALCARALHPTRVLEQQPWVRAIVRRRVATLAVRLRHGDPVDLYQDLTADVPLLVLARLMALPATDVRIVKEFSRAALELFWAPVDPVRQQQLADVVGRYHAVLRHFAADAGGLVGDLRTYAQRHGWGPDVPVAALFFLLVAGQETTSQFLTLLLYRLTKQPRILDAVCRGKVKVADVVEEGLRLIPPIETWRRVAAHDTQLGGITIPAGRSVVLWLARAGRDPAMARCPQEFHPGQPGSRSHVAFGAGTHRCLGAQVSRMESAILVEETAPLLRTVEVVRAPRCPDNLSFRMPDAFVVRRARVITGS